MRSVRISGVVPIALALLAGVVGVALGLSAGFYGGRADMLIMRLVDILLAFPGLLLAIAIIAVIGPGRPFPIRRPSRL